MLLLGAIVLAACAPRGTITLDPGAAAVGDVAPIFVATSRRPVPGAEVYSSERSRSLDFARFAVSVPPQRAPGSVTFPDRLPPDPREDFLTVSAARFADEAAFVASIDAAIAGRSARDREAIVFVHGFNTTFAEGLYRQAQMRHDFATPGVSIHFAWPSRGSVRAYATDRESALIARDDLARLLAVVARSDVSGIILVGHSMGAQIVAESLRQLAIAGAPQVFGKLEYIVLVAPDIDIDVFRGQLAPIRDKDLPIVVFVSDQDRALRMSSLLRGSGERLGSLRDTAAVAGFPITVVVTSRLEGTDDPRGHFKLATSPAMISLVSGMSRLGVETLSDEARASSLFETSINVLQGVTEVVLDPVSR